MAQIAELQIKVDTSDIGKAEKALNKFKRGTDNASKAVQDFSKKYGQGIKKANAAVLKSTAAATVAIAGIGAASLKAFSDFEGGFGNVVTLLDDSSFTDLPLTQGIEGLRQGVKDLAGESGETFDNLNKGLFDLVSAGVPAEKAIATLRSATQLAAAGATDTSTAVDGITSALNGFGEAAGTAEQVAQKFFTAQKFGKTTIAELSSNLGKVAATADGVGVSFEELLAATSAVTLTGKGTSEVISGLKATLSNIAKPTSEAAKAAEQLGINFDLVTLQEKGLQKFFADIRVAAGDNKQVLTQLFGSVEALDVAFALTGSQAENFSNILNELNNQTSISDTFQTALGVKTDELGFKFNQFLGSVKRLAVEFGSGLAPAISSALDVINKTLADPAVVQNISQLATSIGNGIQSIATGISGFLSDGERVSGIINGVGGTLSFLASNFDKVVASIGVLIGLNIATTVVVGITALAKAFKFLTLTMLSNPIFAGGVAIASLTAFLATSEKGRQVLVQFARDVGDGFTMIGTLISKSVKGWIAVFKGGLNFLQNSLEGWKAIFSGKLNIVDNTFKAVGNIVKGAISALGKLALSVGKGIVDGVKSGIGGLLDVFKSAFSAIDNFLKQKVTDFFNSGKKLISTLADGIKAGAGKLKQVASDALQGVRNLLPFSDAKEGPLSTLTKSGRAIPETLADGVVQGSSTLINSLKDVFDELKKEAEKLTQQLTDTFKTIGGEIGNVFSELATTGSVSFQTLSGSLKNALQSGFNFANQRGVFDPIKDGLTGAFKSATSGLGSLIGGGVGKAIAGLGAFAGPIGAGIGAIAGKFVGPLIDKALGALKGKPRATGRFGVDDGQLTVGSVATGNGGSATNLQKIQTQAAQLVNGVLDETGTSLTGSIRSFFKEKKGKFFIDIDNAIGAVFKDVGSASGFIAKKVLTSGQIDGLSDSIVTVLKNTASNNLEVIAQNVQTALAFDKLISGESEKPLTAIEQALQAITTQFANIRDRVDALGLDASRLLEAEANAFDELRQGFVDDINRAIVQGQGLGGVNDLQDLLSAQQTRLSDAGALGLGADDLAQVEKLGIIERRKLIQGFNDKTLAEVVKLADASGDFALKADVVAVKLASLAEIQAQTAESSVQAFEKAAVDIRGTLDDLFFSNLSPLNRTQQLERARSQFNQANALAQSGDIASLQSLPALSRNFLDLSRDVNASSVAFQTDFSNVESALNQAATLSETQATDGITQTALLSGISESLLNGENIQAAQLQTLQQLNANILGQNVIPLNSGSSASQGNTLVEQIQQLVTTIAERENVTAQERANDLLAELLELDTDGTNTSVAELRNIATSNNELSEKFDEFTSTLRLFLSQQAAA